MIIKKFTKSIIYEINLNNNREIRKTDKLED